MSFAQWLDSKGFPDESALTAEQRSGLLASWKAEAVRTEDKKEAPDLDAVLAANEAEQQRRRRIADIAASTLADRPDLHETVAVISRSAVEAKWDVQRLEVELLRATRAGVQIRVPVNPQIDNRVIEAALCRAGGLENLEQQFDARTLEASDKHFKGGLGLQDVIRMCARQNGWRGDSLKGAFDSPSLLRAAFRGGDPHEIRAGVTGPSTYSLTVILSNVANKFLRVGFESVDMAWKAIAATRPVNDFKQISTAALTGSLIFKQLPPGGEIQHGDIGERTYTNQADTQAIMLGIDRRDLINDDLGALTSANRRVGRGGALRLNQMFWTVFLNNSSFFTAGNNNVITGGGSALSLTSLADADRVFRLQTDPDGQPLGVFPAILLVPSALRIAALNLMNSTTVVATNTGTTTTLSPANNVLAGAYQVVSSPYMSNAAFTGNSATAWYLLAAPSDMPVIEVVFLNGVDTPTVETTEADFNTLGIAMRGFIDAGVALQEFRGGVRAAGA